MPLCACACARADAINELLPGVRVGRKQAAILAVAAEEIERRLAPRRMAGVMAVFVSCGALHELAYWCVRAGARGGRALVHTHACVSVRLARRGGSPPWQGSKECVRGREAQLFRGGCGHPHPAACLSPHSQSSCETALRRFTLPLCCVRASLLCVTARAHGASRLANGQLTQGLRWMAFFTLQVRGYLGRARGRGVAWRCSPRPAPR